MHVEDLFSKVSFLGHFDIQNSLISTNDAVALLPSMDNPRWIVPIKNRALFTSSLAIYQPSSLRAKVLKQIIILAASILKPSLVLRHKAIFSKQDDILRKEFKRNNLYYAIFSGSEGIHRKVSIQVMDQNGAILAYVKISDHKNTHELLDNEARILQYLSQSSIGKHNFPRIICYTRAQGVNILVVDTIKTHKSKYNRRLSYSHIAFLSEMFQKTSTFLKFTKSQFFFDIEHQITSLSGIVQDIWEKRFRIALGYLTQHIGKEIIPFGLCHRDYTPWNTFYDSGRLFVFDWEYAKKCYPPLLDLFHFIIQDSILVKKENAPSILRRLKKNMHFIEHYLVMTGLRQNIIIACLLSYLMDITLLYLTRQKLQKEQTKLNMITTWGQMIDIILDEGWQF